MENKPKETIKCRKCGKVMKLGEKEICRIGIVRHPIDKCNCVKLGPFMIVKLRGKND